MIDSTLVVSLVVGFGLLARFLLNLHRENVALRQARIRSAALMRRVRRERDAYAHCVVCAGDDYEELEERCAGLEEELAEFRREEAIRDAANRAAVQMRFN